MNDSFASLLFASLRRMDSEATTDDGTGKPCGLNYFGRHARPQLTRPPTEPCWSKRLTELLNEAKLLAVSEQRYPSYVPSRQNCDVVVQLEAGAKLWLELKGAWRDYWGGKGLYRSYLLHPLVNGLTPKSHTAALDLVKLAQLQSADAEWKAFLLVGFEDPADPMNGDVAELERLAGLADWQKWTTEWPSRADPKNQRVCCWLWCRRVQ